MRATNSSLWNGFHHVIVGAGPETLDLVLDIIEAREDQDRRLYLRTAQHARSASKPDMSGKFRSRTMMS